MENFQRHCTDWHAGFKELIGVFVIRLPLIYRLHYP